MPPIPHRELDWGPFWLMPYLHEATDRSCSNTPEKLLANPSDGGTHRLQQPAQVAQVITLVVSHLPSHQLTWNLTGGGLKDRIILKGPSVRFHW